MTDLPDLTNLTDDELSRSLSIARNNRTHLHGVDRVHTRARTHAAADESRAEARRQLDALLRSRVYTLTHGGGKAEMATGIADLWVVANVEDVTVRQHELIDEAESGLNAGAMFPPSPEEVAAKLAPVEADIVALEAEQERRAEARAKQAQAAEDERLRKRRE